MGLKELCNVLRRHAGRLWRGDGDEGLERIWQRRPALSPHLFNCDVGALIAFHAPFTMDARIGHRSKIASVAWDLIKALELCVEAQAWHETSSHSLLGEAGRE